MMLLEIRVRFDRFDSRFPFGVPVVGDVQDILHEDLEVNKNSTLEIFANIVVIVASAVPVDSVRVAFLFPPDGRPKGDGGDVWHRASDLMLALWRLDIELDRRRKRRVNTVRLDRWRRGT